MSLVHLQFDRFLTVCKERFGKTAVDNVYNKLKLSGLRLSQSGFSRYINQFMVEVGQHRPDVDVCKLMVECLTNFVQEAPLQANKRPVINNHFHIQSITTEQMKVISANEAQATSVPERPENFNTNAKANHIGTKPALDKMPTPNSSPKRSPTPPKDEGKRSKKRNCPFPFICKIAECIICSAYYQNLNVCAKAGCARPHIIGGKHYLSHKMKRRLTRDHEFRNPNSSTPTGTNGRSPAPRSREKSYADPVASTSNEFSTDSEGILHLPIDTSASYLPPANYDDDDDRQSVSSISSAVSDRSIRSVKRRGNEEDVEELRVKLKKV